MKKDSSTTAPGAAVLALRVVGAFASAMLVLGLAAPTVSADGHRQMGMKYSPLEQINAKNVSQLVKAWEYRTGEISHDNKVLDSFQDEPSLVDGNLVVCTTSRRLIALDPATGAQRWVHDPKSKPTGMRKCRGITAWTDPQAAADTMCKTRILLGTADYRLVAVDSKTGKGCPGFGKDGVVEMPTTKPILWPGEVAAASRPAVVNGVVVVGSAVADEQRLEAPSGRVLAFDARSGKPLWEFDPIPRKADDPASKTWLNEGEIPHGGGNVWSEMAVDESLDMVYLPTTAASLNFYGVKRPGTNSYTSSVVALKGKTGEVAWHFQFVHHDIWDYDTPAQPLLVDLPYNGKLTPALVQNTKQGLIFIFDRRTGEPLVPFYERPVPQTGAIDGEWLSPTQPFPVGMPALSPQGITPDDAWGFSPIDRWLCKKRIEELQYGPMYTPPGLKGTIIRPSVGGGPNWGGGAYDPKTHLMVVPANQVPVVVTLKKRDPNAGAQAQKIESRGAMTFPYAGTEYEAKIEPLLSALGSPCTAPPWADLTAIDLAHGTVKWKVALGDISKLAPIPLEIELGTPGAGGPLVTAGGLVFIGYTLDDKMRAFDLMTGETLWKTVLPAGGNATPVSYEVNGEQYVVITAGGHSMYGSTKGDHVVAYKLKR